MGVTINDFDNFEGWVEQGISTAQLEDVERLSPEAARSLCENAARLFTTDLAPVRMWEALRRPLVMFDPERITLAELLQVTEGRCWLVPETGRRLKPVYGLQVSDVPRLLDACPVDFDYYVVGPDLDWIAMLSDHDRLYVMGSLVAVLSAKGELYE